MKVLDRVNIKLRDLEIVIAGFRFIIPAKVVRASLRKYGFIEGEGNRAEISLDEKELEVHYNYILSELKRAAIRNNLYKKQTSFDSGHLIFLLEKQEDGLYIVFSLDFKY